jgi:hypothetical protein
MEDLLRLFAVCVFPVHVWAYINFFYNAPSLVIRMNIWDISGVLAYVLAFAFIESVIIFILLLLLSILLPSKWIRNKLVAKGTAIVLIIFLFLIPVHFYQNIKTIFVSKGIWTGLWILLGIIVVILMNRIVQRNETIEKQLINLADRIIILSIIFVILDFIALGIVVVRNLF